MRKLVKYLGICLSVILFTACTPRIVSKKLDATAEPVKDLTIAISMGNLSSVGVSPSELQVYNHEFKDAFTTRFPDIFKKNGVEVKKILVEGPAAQGDLYPKTLVDNATTSHVLLIKGVAFVKQNGMGFINFDVSLMDVQRRLVAWTEKAQLSLVVTQPLLRTQVVAGQILNGMQKDGLIHMKQEHSIDFAGEEIKAGYYGGSKDR